jgi:hypothetical protein
VCCVVLSQLIIQTKARSTKLAWIRRIFHKAIITHIKTSVKSKLHLWCIKHRSDTLTIHKDTQSECRDCSVCFVLWFGQYISLCAVETWSDWWVMNWNGFRRKLSLPNLQNCPGICQEVLKSTESLRQNSRVQVGIKTWPFSNSSLGNLPLQEPVQHWACCLVWVGNLISNSG